jgi:folylpolyglutamate synthase/dihydropteroate synthase
VPPEQLQSIAASLELSAQQRLRVDLAPDPASALDAARRRAMREGVVCVTGSLFLAAEVRKLLNQDNSGGSISNLKSQI